MCAGSIAQWQSIRLYDLIVGQSPRGLRHSTFNRTFRGFESLLTHHKIPNLFI